MHGSYVMWKYASKLHCMCQLESSVKVDTHFHNSRFQFSLGGTFTHSYPFVCKVFSPPFHICWEIYSARSMVERIHQSLRKMWHCSQNNTSISHSLSFSAGRLEESLIVWLNNRLVIVFLTSKCVSCQTDFTIIHNTMPFFITFLKVIVFWVQSMFLPWPQFQNLKTVANRLVEINLFLICWQFFSKVLENVPALICKTVSCTTCSCVELHDNVLTFIKSTALFSSARTELDANSSLTFLGVSPEIAECRLLDAAYTSLSGGSCSCSVNRPKT